MDLIAEISLKINPSAMVYQKQAMTLIHVLALVGGLKITLFFIGYIVVFVF
jgi:hypothetical protein